MYNGGVFCFACIADTIFGWLVGATGLVLKRGTKYLRHFSLDMANRDAVRDSNAASERDTSSTSGGSSVVLLFCSLFAIIKQTR